MGYNRRSCYRIPAPDRQRPDGFGQETGRTTRLVRSAGSERVTMSTMLGLFLQPHSETPCSAVSRIGVRLIVLPEGALSLSYQLEAKLDQLRIPAPNPAPCRRDELWRNTCFEVFIAVDGERGYREFNFSPSGDWAVYEFDDYRFGMRSPEMPVALRLDVFHEVDGLRLDVTLPPGLIQANPAASSPLRLAIATVIELADGSHGYWALRHPPGKPDFHHASGFDLRLAVC
jgi:hypothetical protein